MATEKDTTTARRGRYITFPEAIDSWLEDSFTSKGHRHVNEFVIDIVREAWRQNQQPETEPDRAVA